MHLADAGGRGRVVVEVQELVAPVSPNRAQGPGAPSRAAAAEPPLGAWSAQPGRRGHVLGQRGLEDRQRLAELHRAALELAEHLEQLLGRLCCSSAATTSAECPPSLAQPEGARPATPSGSDASLAPRSPPGAGCRSRDPPAFGILRGRASTPRQHRGAHETRPIPWFAWHLSPHKTAPHRRGDLARSLWHLNGAHVVIVPGGANQVTPLPHRQAGWGARPRRRTVQ